MTHAMRFASLASALEAGALSGKAPGGIVAVDGEIASVDNLDDLIETIPRLALMVCSATAAELMEVDSGGTLKLLSRSGADVETTCPRMQIPLGQLGRNLVLIVWGPPGTAISERDLEQLTAYSSLAGASLAGRARAAGTLRSVSSAKSFARKPAHSDARYTFDDLIGDDPAFLDALEIARRVSQSDVPILITGESGTGKEMFAQAIHNATPGTAPTFVGINVAAIPRELLESELFGYEKGAFTGARNSGHAGKFEVAGRGTLLLDEIGDMPMEMQTRLLRVLQERVVQRLGSARNIPLHARVIATSHRDLEEAVADGTFRLDLFHRLRVVHLKLPPLRQRRGDVPLLVEHYLRRYADRLQRTPIDVAPDVMAQLERYEWPGNVRELANLIEGEASLLPLDQNVIRRVPASIETVRRPAGSTSNGAQLTSRDEILPLEEVERRAYEQALLRYGGNVARAAGALGVSKGTLYNKIKRYRLLPRARGFTLLELLVVMVLIGLLAGFVAPRYFAQVGKSQVKVARAQIDALDKALDQFRIDVGHYPTSEQGLQALVVQPNGETNWAGPYLKKGVPADPWNRPYVYQQPGTHGGDFDLFSYGKDGRAGGTGEDADITNW